MSELFNDRDTVARELCANWRTFDSFAWDNDDTENANLCGIWYYSNRDSGLISQSNAKIIESWYKDNFRESELIWMERHNHWAVGYLDCLVFQVYTDDTMQVYTDEFNKWYHDIYEPLKNYPILDESDYNELEYNTLLFNIEDTLCYANFNVKDEIDYSAISSYLKDNYPEDTEDVENSYPDIDHVREACESLGYLIIDED